MNRSEFDAQLETKRIARDAVDQAMETARLAWKGSCSTYEAALQDQLAKTENVAGLSVIAAAKSAVDSAKVAMDAAHNAYKASITTFESARDDRDVFAASASTVITF